MRTTTSTPNRSGYKQSLGRRHVQMIAIGGAIGTGLFLGSASRLHSTGPALLLSYAFVGVIAYFLMRALGELVLHRADLRRLRLLHARVLRREGRVRHRLDVLAELGPDRHRRALGRRPLRPVLVPDHADLGHRADRAGRRPGHQPALRPRVRRVRVLGRRSSRSARSSSSSSSARRGRLRARTSAVTRPASRTCGATRAASGPPRTPTTGTGRSWSCPASCSPTPPSRWSAWPPARWRTPSGRSPRPSTRSSSGSASSTAARSCCWSACCRRTEYTPAPARSSRSSNGWA